VADLCCPLKISLKRMAEGGEYRPNVKACHPATIRRNCVDTTGRTRPLCRVGAR
jgi:hypothetical protein